MKGIENLWLFDTSPFFSEAERVALQFALQVSKHPNAATDADSDTLKLHDDENQIVETGRRPVHRLVSDYMERYNGYSARRGISQTAKEQLGHRGWEIGKHA